MANAYKPIHTKTDVADHVVHHDAVALSARLKRDQDLLTWNVEGSLHLVSDFVEQFGWVILALRRPPTEVWIADYTISSTQLDMLPASTAKSEPRVRGFLRLGVSAGLAEQSHKDLALCQIGPIRKYSLVVGYPFLTDKEPYNSAEAAKRPWLVEPRALSPGQDLRLSRLPDTLQEIIGTVPKHLISMHTRRTASRPDTLKLWLEDYTGHVWDWWPFLSPLREVQGDKCLVEWKASRVVRIP